MAVVVNASQACGAGLAEFPVERPPTPKKLSASWRSPSPTRSALWSRRSPSPVTPSAVTWRKVDPAAPISLLHPYANGTNPVGPATLQPSPVRPAPLTPSDLDARNQSLVSMGSAMDSAPPRPVPYEVNALKGQVSRLISTVELLARAQSASLQQQQQQQTSRDGSPSRVPTHVGDDLTDIPGTSPARSHRDHPLPGSTGGLELLAAAHEDSALHDLPGDSRAQREPPTPPRTPRGDQSIVSPMELTPAKPPASPAFHGPAWFVRVAAVGRDGKHTVLEECLRFVPNPAAVDDAWAIAAQRTGKQRTRRAHESPAKVDAAQSPTTPTTLPGAINESPPARSRAYAASPQSPTASPQSPTVYTVGDAEACLGEVLDGVARLVEPYGEFLHCLYHDPAFQRAVVLADVHGVVAVSDAHENRAAGRSTGVGLTAIVAGRV